jgi:hypothetical protein
VRTTIFKVALLAAMAANQVSPAISQTASPPKLANPQNNAKGPKGASPPKRSIPPHLVKECADYLAPRLGSTKIVGPFSEASFSNPLAKWVWEKKRLIIAAPSITTGLFGQVSKRSVGCMFAVEDGKFEFVKPLGSEAFPERYARAPGDPK